ncbi:MAG TPA: permease [Patescibacteria group bacterium]|nr:permease [Patescibacteria group bacterium]
MNLLKRERALGVAHGKRVYDLPLNRGSGSGFLVLLIGLMTFLAMMALAASFALSAMTARWSSGLEDRLTVEIPATDAGGQTIKHDDVKSMTDRIATALQQHPAVANVHVLDDQEITNLVKPWLGDDLPMANLPVPGLISVQLRQSDPSTLKQLSDRITSVDARGRLDTHEEWLRDIIRFTGALQFAAAILTIVIGVTTAAAVAGAVRARMAVNRDEIEILHLMGAADSYISRQFQRHSLVLALQGAFAGMMAGMLVLATIGWICGRMEVDLVPDFALRIWQMLVLACLPVAAAGISMVTARHTVDTALKQLP